VVVSGWCSIGVVKKHSWRTFGGFIAAGGWPDSIAAQVRQAQWTPEFPLNLTLTDHEPHTPNQNTHRALN
jgi:hypothetical protein